MNQERIGALIDAVYAISMTILVLGLPVPGSGSELSKSISEILLMIVDYCLTFILLFAFWFNQRRINDFISEHTRMTLWLNGLALMTVCLLPFSATILYKLGGEYSSLFQFNQSALADLFFVGVCLSVDLLIHLILWVIRCSHCHADESHKQVNQLIRSRQLATAIVILVMFLTFALPGPNRRSLIITPLVLIFEDELMKLWEWILKPRQTMG